MKNRLFLLTLFLSILPFCAQAEKFVDERFNKPLYSTSTAYDDTQVLYLTPNEIYYQDQGEKFKFDCLLLENKIGYLKFKCTNVYSRKHPARIKGYQQIMTFRLYKSEYDDLPPKCDRVRQEDYGQRGQLTYMANYCIWEKDPTLED